MPETFEMVQREMARRVSGKNRHSGIHIFSGKIKCGDCGSWYGSKLWHSNDAYKRTIWQCNQKYKNEIRCKTPYLDEEDIKARFMTAANILLSGRKKAIKAFEEAQATVFDTTELTAKQNEYRSEMEVVSQMMQRCIRENATISSLKKCRFGPFLSKQKMKKSTDWCIESMRIKTPNQETKIRSLSGGNQQKVILGRWLLTEPTVLLLDEPTRGIDVGAKYEIYELIINLAAKGKTVIMVSSEMAELLGVCDRILVMSGGRLAGEVNAATTSQEEIMALAAKYA